MSVTDRRIDAHLHLWDLTVSDYSWLTPAAGELYATWTADRAWAELSAAGITDAVLVQAEDSRADTRFLLDQATAHPWIRGVVGWVPLDDPAAAERDLDEWQREAVFCGVRHLINDDDRRDLLDRAVVRTSLRVLAARGLPFDLHDAWPRHLAQAVRVGRAVPDLVLVLDHLGKPPRARGDMAQWRAALAELARNPRVVAKLSGLDVAGAPFTVPALREIRDTALELFGADRLMYGGDWPVTSGRLGYSRTWQVMGDLIAELSPSEQDSLLAGTARRVYHLGETRPG